MYRRTYPHCLGSHTDQELSALQVTSPLILGDSAVQQHARSVYSFSLALIIYHRCVQSFNKSVYFSPPACALPDWCKDTLACLSFLQETSCRLMYTSMEATILLKLCLYYRPIICSALEYFVNNNWIVIIIKRTANSGWQYRACAYIIYLSQLLTYISCSENGFLLYNPGCVPWEGFLLYQTAAFFLSLGEMFLRVVVVENLPGYIWARISIVIA